MNPTAGAQAAASPAVAAKPVGPARQAAEVVYSAGELEVTASNSSLNQILREIASKTGMKITGGVADERVFGKYGPAPPAHVLASLLEGTGSNMLLRETAKDAPGELILTPRNGGASPPNPNASRDEESGQPARPAQVMGPGQRPGPAPAPPVYATPVATPVEAPPDSAPDPSSTDPASPNGVKTPEQVSQELQRLQQQQQANPQ